MNNQIERVLVSPRANLAIPEGVTRGIVPINWKEIDHSCFGFLPRKEVDAKTNSSVQLGQQLPQLLGYVVINTPRGYLSYARKGKETGLHGKRSIGFGGHVDMSDFDNIHHSLENNIHALILEATHRELMEELDISTRVALTQFDYFVLSNTDSTSKVHVGLFAEIFVEDVDTLDFAENEVLDVKYLTLEQLTADVFSYEAWSQEIIFAKAENTIP